MRPLILLITGVILFLFQACSGKENKETKQQAQQKIFPVTEVMKDKPHFNISLPGELMPYEQVKLYPRVKGFIKKLYADRGSKVQQGQLLAELDAPEIMQQYLAKKSAERDVFEKFQYSRQAYKRLQAAAKKNGAVAAIELDKALSQMLSDSAAYQSAKADRAVAAQLNNYLRITAPFNGIITGRYVSAGALVGDNAGKEDPLFELGQQDKLRLTVAIPEKQVHSLPKGTKAVFTVVDLPGEQFTAMLSRNSGLLDPSLRSVIAEFDVTNTNGKLRGGQFAKVNIALERADSSLWVPVTSVVQSQSGVFVLKVKNNIAQKISVETGGTNNNLMEVFGDLQPGDQVLLNGTEEMKNGTTIQTTKGR